MPLETKRKFLSDQLADRRRKQIKQNYANLSLVNPDHQENIKFVKQNRVVLDIPEENKK